MRKALKYLAFLALAGVLLHFSFKGVKWSDFIYGMRNCSWGWIILSMAIGILGFLVRALRWRLLLRSINKEVTVREAFDGINIGYLTNFALPRAGEMARCGVIANTKKISFESCLGSVVVERSIDMVCLLLWMAILLLFKWGEFGEFVQTEISQPLFGKMNSILWPATVTCGLLLIAAIVVWFFRHTIVKVSFVGKVLRIARGIVDGILSAFRMQEKWMFLLYTLLIWLTYWLTSLLTIYSFPQVGNLDGTDALFLMIIGGFGWCIPVQGGLGAYHFIVSLALTGVYGISQTTGIVFATISHEAQAFIMLLCGTASFISMSLWKKRINQTH